MQVDNILIAQVVKSLLNQNGGSNELTKFYGTVATVDGRKCVKLDGSDTYTAVVEGTEVIDGDRVLVGIENHQAVVYANITSPASARTATNFMDFGEDGLIIGELENDNNEFNVLIRPNGVFIRNGFGNDAIVLAVYNGDGVTLCDESGNGVAKFADHALMLKTLDGNNETVIRPDSIQMKWKNGNTYNYNRLSSSGFWLNNPGSSFNAGIGVIQNSETNDDNYEILGGGTWKNNIGRVTLSFGVWLINFGGSFSAESGGTRQFVLNNSSSGTPSQTRQDIVISPAGSHGVRAIQPRIVRVSDSPVAYYLHAYNGASAPVNVYPFIRAVRIA